MGGCTQEQRGAQKKNDEDQKKKKDVVTLDNPFPTLHCVPRSFMADVPLWSVVIEKVEG